MRQHSRYVEVWGNIESRSYYQTHNTTIVMVYARVRQALNMDDDGGRNHTLISDATHTGMAILEILREAEK